MKAVFSELSDEELLSNFIPKAVANKLMKEYQSIHGVVMNTAEIDTKNLRGFGKNKPIHFSISYCEFLVSQDIKLYKFRY